MEENLSQANETSAGESGKGFAVVAGQIGIGGGNKKTHNKKQCTGR